MAVSSQLVITGSYGTAEQPAIRAFGFNPVTGELAPIGEYCGILNPSFIAVHPSGRWLYAVSETSSQEHGRAGQVHALSIQINQGEVRFTPLNAKSSDGDYPCHLRVEPSGNSLLVANYGSGSVGAFPLRNDGSLGEMQTLTQHQGRGAHPERQEGPHAHSTIFTPEAEFAIAADLGIDALVIYRHNNGRLTKAAQTPTAAGAGPRHMAFHPNQRVLYVANELNGTLTAYDYLGGVLTERETLTTLPENPPENLVADLHVSPAGDRVYVSNRGHNSLAVYEAAPDGDLSLLNWTSCGGDWPRNFAISPNGGTILVANQYSGDVVSLPVQSGASEAGEPSARIAVPDVSCVIFAEVPG